MNLALAAIVLHVAAIAICLWYAVLMRHSTSRNAAILLALVWLGGFILNQAHTVVVHAFPPPGTTPYAGARNLALLALAHALYFAWPALILAWVRWSFRRSHPWPVVLAWLVAWGLPTAVYPAIRGATWYHFAGALHLAALAVEIASIAVWVRKREAPRFWHVAGMVAACMTALPAIPFLSPNEAREGYLLWVLRGLILGHLSIVAIVGGELWSRKT